MKYPEYWIRFEGNFIVEKYFEDIENRLCYKKKNEKELDFCSLDCIKQYILDLEKI